MTHENIEALKLTGVRDRAGPLARWLQILVSVLLLLKLEGLYWVGTHTSKKCYGNIEVLEVYAVSDIKDFYLFLDPQS